MLRTKVLIKIPEAKLNLYNTIPFYQDLFDGDYLVLKLKTEQYAVVYEGEQTSFLTGFGANVVKSAYKRKGFDVTTDDGREAIELCLEAAIAEANADPYKYSPILVRDYVRRDGEAEYKTRLGAITEFEPKGGTVTIWRDGEQYRVSKGLRFVFMEIEKQFLL